MKPEQLFKELQARGLRLTRRLHEHLQKEEPTVLPDVAEELLAVIRLMDFVGRERSYHEKD